MSKREAVGSLVFLQVAVAAFLILLGVAGIVSYNTDINKLGRAVTKFFGGRSDSLGLVISILSLVAGVICVLGLFFSGRSTALHLAILGTFVFWALRIVYYFFQGKIFEPNALVWLQRLSPDVVVLASLWLVSRRYS